MATRCQDGHLGVLDQGVGGPKPEHMFSKDQRRDDIANDARASVHDLATEPTVADSHLERHVEARSFEVALTLLLRKSSPLFALNFSNSLCFTLRLLLPDRLLFTVVPGGLLAGGGAGSLIVEYDDVGQLTSFLQPYVRLMSFDVRAISQLEYDTRVQDLRQVIDREDTDKSLARRDFA